MAQTDEKVRKPIKCEHCKHDWLTASVAPVVTCSHCGKKTPNPNAPVLVSAPVKPTEVKPS